jgi:hypothetical protein
MPRGANRKREHEYEQLKTDFEREGRYPGREEEVAARIVNKQRRAFGETRSAQRAEREGRTRERGLPIPGYEHLTVSEVTRRLASLTPGELRRVGEHERMHKNRASLLRTLDRALSRH